MPITLPEPKYFDDSDSKRSEDSYDSSSSTLLQETATTNAINSCWRMGFATFFHLAIVMLLSISTIFIKGPAAAGDAVGFTLVKSPAQEAVKYERQTVDNSLEAESLYVGEPSQEIDDRWDAILKNRNLALDPSLLDGDTSVEINDGSGKVLANLNVFYNLHCLNFVRKYAFRDAYPLQYPENGRRPQQDYVIHCLDSIRQSLMCHGDVALHTYSWEDFQLVPYPNFKVEHECKNWDSIANWAAKHKASSLTGNKLMHPTWGPSYPNL